MECIKPVAMLRSAFVILFFCIALPAGAALKKVFPGRNSIRNAVAAAMAGDVLQLQPGIYKEHDIVIDKKITISGVNFPVIDGERTAQIFLVQAAGVEITGLQIQNTGHSSLTDMAGVKVINTRNVIIRNNRFYNDNFAIYSQNASAITIENNEIRGNAIDELNSGNGIHAWKSDHLNIRANNISSQRDGIYFEFVTESKITQNRSFNNVRYGLHFMFSHNDVYSGNVFSGNGAGVAVMYSKGVEMYHNTFSENWGDASYGILLKEITDSRIAGNVFTKNTVGIYMEGTTRIHIWNNLFKDNGWAMRIQASCSGSNFEHNDLIGNSFDIATNGSLVLNTFNSNYWDKYDGYDLDKNGVGDVPYYPVSLFSVVSEKTPTTMILFHSLLSRLMDQAEKVMPSIIPDQLRDNSPMIKRISHPILQRQ